MRRTGPPIDDTKPIWRPLLVFLVPLMLANTVQSASQTFTSIFLGRMIGVDALATASSVFPLVFFLVSFFFGIASGSSVLIGQAYGAQNEAQVKRVGGTTLTFAVLAGIVIGGIGLVFVRPLLQLVGTPAAILAPAAAYARIIFIGLPITFVFLGSTTLLRGVGDSRTPFIALIASTLISIGCTPALIRGVLGLPPLGVSSAAISSVVASALTVIGLAIALERRGSPLALSRMRHAFGIDPPVLSALIRIGVPTGVQLVMASLSEIAVISFVNRFGFHATAAYGAVNQVVSYVQFPAITIGIAASIFGAQAIGAQKHDRLVKIVRAAVTLNYVIGGILIAVVYVLGEPILSLFLTDPGTREIAYGLLRITLWSYLIFGNTAVLSGIMRSSGTVFWPTLLSVTSIWGVEVPVAYALSHGPLGLRGVWIAYPVAYLAAVVFQSVYYFAFWRRRTIVALLPAEGTG